MELNKIAFGSSSYTGMNVEEYMIGQCIMGLMANPKLGEMLYTDSLKSLSDGHIVTLSRMAISQARSLIKEHRDALNWHKEK